MMIGERLLREDPMMGEVQVFSSAKLNIRLQDPYFPNSIPGKIFGPHFTFLKASENTAPLSIFPFAKRVFFH